MTLIGIGGAARAGKSAIAEVLEREFGFQVLNMSDALSDALYALNPIVFLPQAVRLPDGSALGAHKHMRYQALVDLVGYTEAKTVPEVRRLLQFLGTEVGRNIIDEDVWVDIMTRRILALGARARVAVTSIRFLNEIDMIYGLYGATLYVIRPEPADTLRAHQLAAQPTSAHSSETSVSEEHFSHLIVNDGTLNQLAMKVSDFARAQGAAPIRSTVAATGGEK